MQRVEARAVMLEATHAVEIEPGVFLPPDHYKGTEWRTGRETMSGDISWTALQYKIELTADQFASMPPTSQKTQFLRKSTLRSSCALAN